MFDLFKYKALAYDSPFGRRLRSAVDAHWCEWVAKTQNIFYTGSAPSLERFVDSCGGAEVLAHRIFIEAVWGLGVDDWQLNQWTYAACSWRGIQWETNQAIPVQVTDAEFFQEYGVVAPPELVALDTWLESLAVLCS